MGTFTIDILMGIPRSIELVVYFTCAIMIYRRQGYYLNKVYTLSLLGWSVYVICDLLIFPIGHIEPYYWGTIIVNGKEVYLPMIANILRDFQILGSSIIGYGYLYASYVIKNGVTKSKKLNIILAFIGGAVCTTLMIIFFDDIVKDTTVEPQVVKTHLTFMSIIFIIIELFLYFFAIYQHYNVYKQIGKNKPEKRGILYFILGSAFIALGIIYFVIIGRIIPNQSLQLITGPIGHAIWIISPLFIYWGIKKENKKE